MWYAVVAPDVSGVYSSFEPVKRIKALYPYCKFRTVKSEEDGWAFVKRYKNLHHFNQLRHYGSTFSSLCIDMEYFIYNDSIFYNFWLNGYGALRMHTDKCRVQYRADLIMVEMPNIRLDKNTISGNLIAIYHGLVLLGDYVDVDITLPNHSIFYALSSYTGTNRVITRVVTTIRERLGNVAYTLTAVDKEDDYYADKFRDSEER